MADNALQTREPAISESGQQILAALAEVKAQREAFWSEIMMLRERVAVLEAQQRPH